MKDRLHIRAGLAAIALAVSSTACRVGDSRIVQIETDLNKDSVSISLHSDSLQPANIEAVANRGAWPPCVAIANNEELIRIGNCHFIYQTRKAPTNHR